MNFRQQNRIAKKRFVTKIVITIVVVGLLLISTIFESNPLGVISQTVAVPIWESAKSTSSTLRNFSLLLKSKGDLVKEKESLNKQIEKNKHVLLVNEELRNENDELKTLLGRIDTADVKLGVVLSKPAVSPYDILTIDLGLGDGIQVGDLVRVHGDFVIGKIYQVYSNSAQVVLFSSPGEQTTVSIGKDSVSAVAEGRGGGNFKVQIPRDIEVSVEDVVVLPNISLQIFGVIEEVTAAPTDSFKILLFKNPVNISELTWVEVVSKK